jgi:peptide/nickel transport system permease protein
MTFWHYLGRKLFQLALTTLIIVTLIFFLFRVMPGDPVKTIIDPRMPPEARAQLRAQFGLDKPPVVQYLIFLKNAARGNWGVSFFQQEPVFRIIMRKLPNTLLLFTSAVVLAYLIGVPIGKRIAWKRGTPTEAVVTFVGIFFYTTFLPWLALIMIWLFAYKGIPLPWGGVLQLPLRGMMTPEIWSDPASSALTKGLDVAVHLLLPLFVLVLIFFARFMLLMRSSMLDTLEEDYIVTARAKGLEDRVIMNRHAARNAMLPVVTAMALSLAFSLNGGVLTEKVFSWPGLGTELIDAVMKNDYPLAQAAFIFLAVIVLVANLIADILYIFLDPRIGFES